MSLVCVLQPDPTRQAPAGQTPRRGPPPDQPTPRRGWATPSYDQLLDEKRRQEHTYRRSNDPESVRAEPRRDYPPNNYRQVSPMDVIFVYVIFTAST